MEYNLTSKILFLICLKNGAIITTGAQKSLNHTDAHSQFEALRTEIDTQKCLNQALSTLLKRRMMIIALLKMMFKKGKTENPR